MYTILAWLTTRLNGRQMNNIIRISSVDYRIAQDLLINQNKKIGCIKHIRSTGFLYEDGTLQERIDLKSAKEAVEHEWRDALGHVPSHRAQKRQPCAVLSMTPRIKRVVIDCGDGEMELDLDGLQLRLLDGLSELPIQVIGPAMELMQALRDFDDGKSIKRGNDE